VPKKDSIIELSRADATRPAQLRGDLADGFRTLPRELDGSLTELLGVRSGHPGLLLGDIVASSQVSGKPG